MMREIPDLKFGPEWALLEFICLANTFENKNAIIDKLISTPSFSWGELLEQAIEHKVVPLLAYNLISINNR
tara:strand:+ start:274 stop:486 length:213 start_codon:yes stop_codon:yes gene_type:complete